VAPGVVGDLVVAAEADGSLVARALDRGQERWRVEAGRLLQPVLAGPDVAVAVTASGVTALDRFDGGERWQVGPSGDDRVRAWSDGTLVAVRTGSGILAVDASTGDVVGSARLRAAADAGSSRPAITAVESVLVAEGDAVVALR
jgi:outer membrane protein assembly factor BamB